MSNIIIGTDAAIDPTNTPAVDPTPRRKRAAKTTGDASVTNIAGVYRAVKSVKTPADVAGFVERISPRAAFVVNAPGKNVGRFTGRRVVAFQNDTIIENVERKLTDVQILAVWRAEFPCATGAVFASPDITIALRIVSGVRADFNRTGHGEPHRIPAGFVSERVSVKSA